MVIGASEGIMGELDFDQLEQEGYAVVPGFLDRETTGRVREHIDSLLPPIGARRKDQTRSHTALRHPIPGAIMAELVDNRGLLALAAQGLKSRELRLLEQVLIRSDPSPSPHGPQGWHVDWAFLPRHYEAVPRQTYFHMVHCLNTVPAGGAAFMIVPGSHNLTYGASEQVQTAEELGKLKRDPIGVAGVNTSDGIEVCPNEGDLLIFNPMALHSGSSNATDQPRYVYFASFFDTSATELWDELRRTKYREGFPDSLRVNLPTDLQSLLAW
jgi:ectoine hydroxylase-related dioxygenase (phytanoyl-CoA dioxygenase family)